MSDCVRPKELTLGPLSLAVPAFFPSVSSVKTNLQPEDYVAVICALKSAHFLVSSFDLSNAGDDQRRRLAELLRRARHAGAVLLLDSGNYEGFWKQSKDWNAEKFHRVLCSFEFSIAFGFDIRDFAPDPDLNARQISAQATLDASYSSGRPVVPIIHAMTADLPRVAAHVNRLLQPAMVAVAERALGAGIRARIETVRRIRAALTDSNAYVGLHLLGTGHPISIALYSEAGADSFDGLEWCQTVVDYETATLFHSSHADLFRQQSVFADIPAYDPRMLAHNLFFYSTWIANVRDALHEKRLDQLCRAQFPDRVYRECANLVGWKD